MAQRKGTNSLEKVIVLITTDMVAIEINDSLHDPVVNNLLSVGSSIKPLLNQYLPAEDFTVGLFCIDGTNAHLKNHIVKMDLNQENPSDSCVCSKEIGRNTACKGCTNN